MHVYTAQQRQNWRKVCEISFYFTVGCVSNWEHICCTNHSLAKYKVVDSSKSLLSKSPWLEQNIFHVQVFSINQDQNRMMKHSLPPLYPHQRSKNETVSLIHGIYAGLLSCALAIVWYLEYQQSSTSMLELALLSLVVVLMIGFNVLACVRVKKGSNQGLFLSRIMAVLMLFSFPIGTILGIFVLWKSTIKQWEV